MNNQEIVESQLRAGMDTYGVPTGLRDGIVRYAIHHVRPGDFLRAVLENDLFTACWRGDSISVGRLCAIVTCLHHHAPAACWRSPAAVEAWLKAREEAL